MNVIRVNPGVYVLDIGTNGGIKYEICTLRVQPIFISAVWIVSNDIAPLHIFPKKREECVAQAPTSHGQFAKHGQLFHVLWGGFSAPILAV